MVGGHTILDTKNNIIANAISLNLVSLVDLTVSSKMGVIFILTLKYIGLNLLN